MRTCIIGGQEFVIDPYKEPLVQLKGAVKGYMRGTLPYAVSDGKLPCAFCDPGAIRRRPDGHRYPSTFDTLSKHIRYVHNLTPQEYRDAVGLLRKTPLQSRRMKLNGSFQLGNRGNPSSLRKWMEGAASGEAQRLSHLGRVRNNGTSESQNKRGVCRDQFIAMAKDWAKKHDGEISHEMLKAAHTGLAALRQAGISDLGELAALAGAKKWSSHTGSRSDSDQTLLLVLRQHAEELGRTPNGLEMGPVHGTPSVATYRLRFGSWRQACARAGLSPNPGPTPKHEGDGVDILNAYSVVGTISGAAQIVHVALERVTSILTKYGVEHTPGMSENQRREAKAWAATMARRLSGMPDEEGA